MAETDYKLTLFGLSPAERAPRILILNLVISHRKTNPKKKWHSKKQRVIARSLIPHGNCVRVQLSWYSGTAINNVLTRSMSIIEHVPPKAFEHFYKTYSPSIMYRHVFNVMFSGSTYARGRDRNEILKAVSTFVSLEVSPLIERQQTNVRLTTCLGERLALILRFLADNSLIMLRATQYLLYVYSTLQIYCT